MINVTANPDSINSGDFSVVDWEVNYADSCVIRDESGRLGIGSPTLRDGISVNPTVTTIYTVNCLKDHITGEHVTASESVTVTVN